MYAFLRELLWRFKYEDDLFLHYEKRAMLYGKRVKNIVVDDEAIDLLSTTILNLGSDDDIYGLEDFCDFMQDASNDDIMDFITGEVSM